MHVSWFQQLKFCQLVESFCLCKLAAYRMKSYFCNSPGLAVRIIPSDMNMVWSAPVPNDANAPEKEGSVSCNLWRKTLIPIVEQKDETDSKHVRISDLAGLEKQLHVSETCISAEIYCVQWRIFLDTIHLHHFASNFRRIHTHTHTITDLDMEVCYDDGESGEDPKCMAYDMSQDRRWLICVWWLCFRGIVGIFESLPGL